MTARPGIAVLTALTLLLPIAGAVHSQAIHTPMGTDATVGIELRAQVVSARRTSLSAEIGSRVEELPVQRGARFPEGAVLVRLDCRLHEAQLAKAEAERLAASHALEGNRQLESMQAIGTVEVARSEAELLKAEADVLYLETILERCVIRAPFAGRIDTYHVREFTYVQAGTPLVDLIDDRQLELEFVLPSRWLSWLQSEMPFSVAIDDTGKRYPVRLKSMAATVDPISQTVSGIAVLDGVFPELLPGMSGQLILSPPAAQ